MKLLQKIKNWIIRICGGFTKTQMRAVSDQMKKYKDKAASYEALWNDSKGINDILSEKVEILWRQRTTVTASVDTRSMPDWTNGSEQALRDYVAPKAERQLLKELAPYIRTRFMDGEYVMWIKVLKP